VFINQCDELNIAAPVLANEYFAGLEWRGYTSGRGLLPAIAIAPRYTLEMSRGRHAFDMPVWLALDEKQSSLSAGFRLTGEVGGQTMVGEKRNLDWVISFFLGTSFSFDKPIK
jgi:hypothetical protein